MSNEVSCPEGTGEGYCVATVVSVLGGPSIYIGRYACASAQDVIGGYAGSRREER